MAWYDLEEEDDSTLTLASPRASAANFASLGTPEPVEIPKSSDEEDFQTWLARERQAASAREDAGVTSLTRSLSQQAVRLTPERTLGEEFSVGLSRGTDQLEGLAYGFLGLAADGLGIERAADWGYDNYRRAMEEAATQAASVQDPFEDIEDLGDAGRYAVGLLGEQLPQLLTSILGGGIGGAVGKNLAKRMVANQVAKRVAQGATATTAEREVAEEVTKGLLTRSVGAKAAGAAEGLAPYAAARTAQGAVSSGTRYGALTGAYLANLGQISGGTYGQVRDETGEGGDAAVTAALATSVPGAALDTLFQGFVVSKIPGVNKMFGVEGKPLNIKFGPGRVAAGAASGAAIGSALEGTTEYLQTGLEQAAVGMADPNQTIEERLNAPGAGRERMIAGAAGATIGGMLGGGGGALENLAPRTKAEIDKIDGEDKTAPAADPRAGLPREGETIPGTWGSEIDVDGAILRQNQETGLWAVVNPPENYPGTFSFAGELDGQKVAIVNPRTKKGAALLSRVSDIQDGRTDEDTEQEAPAKQTEPPKETLVPVDPEDDAAKTKPSSPEIGATAVDIPRPDSAIQPGGELRDSDRADGLTGRTTSVPDGGVPVSARAADEPRPVFMPLSTPSTDVKNAPPAEAEADLKSERAWPATAENLRREYFLRLGNELVRGRFVRRRDNGDVVFAIPDDAAQMKGKLTKVLVRAEDLADTVQRAGDVKTVEAEFNERLAGAKTTADLEAILSGYVPTGKTQIINVTDNTGARPMPYRLQFFFREGDPKVPTTKQPDGPPVVDKKKLQPALQDVANKASGDEFSEAVSANAAATDQFIQNLEPGEYQVFNGAGEANGKVNVTTSKSGKTKRVQYLSEDGDVIGDAKALAAELNWARAQTTDAEVAAPKTEADVETAQKQAEAANAKAWTRGSLARITRDPVRAPKQKAVLPEPEPVEITRQRIDLSAQLTGVRAKIKEASAPNKPQESRTLTTLREQEAQLQAQLDAFNKANPRPEFQNNPLFQVNANGGVEFTRPVYARLTPLLTSPLPRPAEPELLQPADSRVARTESAQARQALFAAGLRGRDLEEALQERTGMTDRELAEQEQAERERIEKENEARQKEYNENKTNFDQSYNAFKAQVLRALDAGHTVPITEKSVVAKEGRMTVQSGPLGSGLIEFLQNDPDFTIEDRAPADPKTGEAIGPAVPTITGLVWRGLDGKQRPWSARQGSKPASFSRFVTTGETVQVQDPTDWTLTPDAAFEQTTPEQREAMRRTMQREQRQRGDAQDKLDLRLGQIDRQIQEAQEQLETELGKQAANDAARDRRDRVQSEISGLRSAIAGLAADLRFQPTATTERDGLLARQKTLREENDAQEKRKANRADQIKQLQAEYKAELDITSSDRAVSSRSKASAKAAKLKERLDSLADQTKKDSEAQRQRTAELNQITKRLRAMPLKLANEKRKLDVRRAEELQVLENSLAQKTKELGAIAVDNKLGERIQQGRDKLARLRDTREDALYEAERQALAFDRSSEIPPEQQFTKPLRGLGSFARVYTTDRTRRLTSEETRLAQSRRRRLKREDLVQQFSQLPETQQIVFRQILGQLLDMFTSGSSIAARDRVLSQLNRGATITLSDEEADTAVAIARDFASNSAAESFLKVVETIRAKGGAPTTLPTEVQLELAAMLMEEIGNAYRTRFAEEAKKQKSTPTRAEFIAEVRLAALELGISPDDVQEILEASPESAQALLDELRNRGTRQITQVRKVETRLVDKDSRLNEEGKSVVGNLRGRIVEGPLTQAQQDAIDKEVRKLEEQKFKLVRNEDGLLTFTRRVDSKPSAQRAFYDRLNALLDVQSIVTPGSKANMKAQRVSAKALRTLPKDVDAAITAVLARLASNPTRYTVAPATPDVEVAESQDDAQAIRDARLELLELRANLEPGSTAIKEAEARLAELEKNYKTVTVAGRPETRTPIADPARADRETRYLNSLKQLFSEFYKDPDNSPLVIARKAVDAARKQVERDRPRKLKTQQDTVTNEEGDEISLQDLIEANKTNPEAKLYGAGAGNLPPALLARERAEIIRSLPAQVRRDLFEITGLYYDPVIDRLWYRGKTLGSLENIIQKGGSFESFVKGKRKILRKNYSPERLKAVLDAVALMRDEEALNFFDQQRKAQSEQPKPTISLRTTVRDFVPRGASRAEPPQRFPVQAREAAEQRRVEEYVARQNEKRKSGRSGSDAERTVGVGIDLSGVPDSILQSGISDSLGAPIDDVPAQGGVSSAGRASGERSGSVSGNAAQPAARLGRPNTLQPRTIRELTPRATRIFVAAVTGKNVDNLSDDEIDAIYRASDTQAKGGEAVLAGGNVIAQTPQNMADLLATANGFELLTGMALEEQSQARTQERVELFRKNLGDLTEARAFGGIEAFLQAAVDNPALPRKTRLIARELLNASRRLPGTGWNDTIALQIAAFGRNFLSEPVTNKELEKRVKLNADGTAFLVSRAGRGQPEEIPAPKGARAKKAMLAKLQREAMQAIALNSAVPWSGKSVGRDGQYTVYLNLSANHSNREAGAVDTLIHELIHPLIDSKLNGEVELNAVEKAALDRLQKFRREAVLAAAKKKGIDVPEGALSDAEYDTIEAALAQRANQDADQALKSLTDIKEFVNDVIGNPETANLIAELGFGIASEDAKYTPTGRGRGVTGVLRSLWNTITTFVTGRQLDDSSPLAEALRDAWSLTFKSLSDTPTVVDRALNQSARQVSGVRDPEFSPARIYRNALVAELERGIQQERFIRQQIEARNLAGTTGDRNRIVAEFAAAKAQEAQTDAAPPIVAEPENVAAADTNADAAEDNENEVTPGDIRKARLALFQFALSDTEQEFVERINALKQENPDVTFNEVIANVGFDDPIELYYVARGQAATALEKSDLERIAIDIDPGGNVTPEMLQQISARAEREVLSRMDAATIEQDPRTNEWVVRSADRQELTRTRSKAEADAAYQKAVESEPGPAADRLESLAAAARFLASAKLSVTAQKLAGTGLTGSALRQEELGTGRASMFSAAERREILEQFKQNRQRPDAEAGQEFSPEDLAKIKEFEADIAIEEKREAALRAAGEKAAAEFRKRMEEKAKAEPKAKPDTSKLQALAIATTTGNNNPTDPDKPGPDKPKKTKRKPKTETTAVSNTPFRGVNVEAAVADLKFGNWREEADKSGRKRSKRYAKLTDSDGAFWNAYNLNRTANAEYREKAKAAFKAKGYTVGYTDKFGYYVTQVKQPVSEVSESLGAPFERIFKSEVIKTRAGGTYVKDPLIGAISSTMDARAREKFENRGAKINAEASRASSEIRQLARALKDTSVDPRRVTAALGNLDNPFTDAQMAEIALAKIDDPGSVEELESEFRKENRQAARERRRTALQSLPRNVRVIVTRMRDHIDVLQRRLKEEGLVTGDLEVAVDDTYGIYLNRSYAIDDDPRWADKVRKNKKVMADARRFLKKRLVELREEKIRASALRRNEFITDDEIRRQAADSVTTTDVENELDNALSREKLDFMMSSIPGQKNLSVFMRRGVIAPEIQALWGVYNSPDTAYGKTVLKLASLIQNHAYLRELRNLGLSEGWFEAPPTLNEDTEANVYIVRDGLGKEIFRTDDLEEAQEAYAEAMEEFDPPASYKPISAKDNPRLSPLAGVYAMPEMLNALYQVYAPQTEDAQAKAVGFFSKVTGYGMAAATVGSAQGQVRNYWGGWLKLLSVGTFFSLPSGAFGMAHKLAIQEAFKTNGGNYQKTRAEIEKLIRLRIYGESVDANTISSLIKDYNTLGRAVASDDDTMMTKLMRPVLNTWDLAKATYSMSDNIMRTLVFYAERENYRKAYPKMSSEDLDQKAAQLARDLFWTYSEAPEWVQNLKRGPGLVLAPFITFTTEVIRTAINTLRVAGEEIKSDNAELRAVGAKRLAGFASAMTIPYLAGQALMAASGLGSDDEEDLRKFLPKWQQNNQLLLTRGPNNSIGYYDISFLDGADVLKKPFTALWRAIGRSESVTEAVATGSVEMLAEMWRPFLSEQLVFGTVASVLRNVDSSGRRIYNPQDSGANIAQAIASQFVGVQGVLGFTGDGVFVPGTFKTAGRFVRGLTGTVTESGQAINPAQELRALITGTRARQLDLEQALGYSAGEYLRNMRDATSVFNRAFLSRGTQAPGALRAAFEQADIAQYELTKKQREQYLAARRLGLSDVLATSRLKASGVGNDRMEDITSGIYRPFKASEDAKKNAKEQNLNDRLREAEEAEEAANERPL